MKKTSLLMIGLLMTLICQAQENVKLKNKTTMKLNAGIITEKLEETKAFYTSILDFGITFENEFYLLLHTPNHQAELSFLLPNHPSQQPLFQPAFQEGESFLP